MFSCRRYTSTVSSILNGSRVVSNTLLPVVSHKGEQIHQYSPLSVTKEVLDGVCEEAYGGFLRWSKRPFSERSQILAQAATLMENRLKAYIKSHTEIGGSQVFAEVTCQGAVDHVKDYARLLSGPDGSVLKSSVCQLAMEIRQPLGPVLAIATWNAPVVLWTRAILAPLAAGCSVVICSANESPKVPFMIVEDLLLAGVDKEAIQLLQVDPKDQKMVTETLLANSQIRKVNFTGSTAVGREISQVAAKNLKPALLELGGKNVSIVCADASLARAAENLLLSSWLHKGQICMSLDTVYVHESVYDEFRQVLRDISHKMLEDPDFDLNHRKPAGSQKVKELVSGALADGALILGSEDESKDGASLKLTILDSKSNQQLDSKSDSQCDPLNCVPIILENVSPMSRISKEETFGPVLSIQKYQDIQELIKKINKQEFGLKASVWSTDVVSAINIAKQLEFGGVHINSSTVHDEATIPHGGVKESGTGRFNSRWGIDEFCYVKSITVDN